MADHNDRALEWIRSFQMNEDREGVEQNPIGPLGFGNLAWRNVTSAGIFGVAGKRNYPSYEGGNHNAAFAAAMKAGFPMPSQSSSHPNDDFYSVSQRNLNSDKAIEYNDGVLPMLEDKGARSLFLYRDEAKNIHVIDTMGRLNNIILAVSQLKREKSFCILCNELLGCWNKWLQQKYVPVPSKYYTEADYFWILVKKLKKLHRQYGPDPIGLVTTLSKHFNVTLTSKCSDAKGILQKEFHKFLPILGKVKDIERFFKVTSKYELLESEYTEYHKKIVKLIQDLNVIQHDLNPLRLTPSHKLFFTRDLQLAKKRFYVFICRLDAHMKKSADRTHAIRIASCGHFVEIVIEKLQTPPEPEPEPKTQEPLLSHLEDSDSDSISTIHSSEEGWRVVPSPQKNKGNNDVDINHSDNHVENTNHEKNSPIDYFDGMDDYAIEHFNALGLDDNDGFEEYVEYSEGNDAEEDYNGSVTEYEHFP